MYRDILFDLDGTLTDPGEGITNSVVYALEKMGIFEPDKRSLYRFIGPPLAHSFRDFYGMNEEEAEEAIRQYRVYYAAEGIRQNRLIPGISALLERLQAAGKRLFLATSKPEHFAKQILDEFALTPYFCGIFGADMGETRVTKEDVLSYAIEEGGVDPAQAVMVGYREFDVIGAKAHGIPTVGVLFGYGSSEELKNAGAIALSKSAEDLFPLLCPSAEFGKVSTEKS